MRQTKRPQAIQPKKNTATVVTPVILPNRSETILQLLIVFFVPVLLYLQTLSFGFTYFDDDGLIVNNLAFLSDFKNASQVFTCDAFITKISPFYRPLQSLSYMIDIHLSGGNNTWMYHLSNVLLLGLIACLLFLILLRLRIRSQFALLTTIIYCAHPLFVSSVSWIPARGDMQLMLFSLLSLFLFIDYLNKQKLIYLFLHWLAFTTALFCKETAAFLPFIFLFYYLTFYNLKDFKNIYLLNILLYAVSGLFWYWLRAKSIGDFTNRTDVFGLNAILPNLRTIPESLFMFLFPFDIPVIPGFSVVKTIIGTSIIVLLLILTFVNKQRPKKDTVFGILWFLLLIIPTLLFKHVLIDYLNHRFFLPLVGILLIILFILPNELTQKKNNKVLWSMLGIFLLFSIITINNSHAYANLSAFYSAAISKNPRSALSYNNRGHDRIKKNEFRSAIEDFDNAIKININYEMAYNNRGYAKSNLGDTLGAMQDFNSAINIKNDFAEPYFNRGNLNMNLRKYKNAVEDFSNYIALRPNSAEVYNLRGTALGSAGNFQDAITSFNRAIEIKPDYMEAYGNRSIVLYTLKDFKGALKDCEKVLALNPGNANATSLKTMIEKENINNSN